MTARLLPGLARDTRGATVIEFAVCAPVLLMAMLGVFDLGHNMYTSSIIQGAVQKAARDSTIEGAAGKEAQLDARVTKLVHQIAPRADLEFRRTAYTSFSDVGEPEDWNDVNGNGACDDGEPFEDANGNGSWDANMGKTGFGGARDAVLYEVEVTWERIVPITKLLGQSSEFSTTARTVLRNQPYGAQNKARPTENCA
ncbi:MAG: pilus assembly protein [Novosphingobium sp.]|nr:pilus assembly protein [Novosphingobium sp.]